jgi:ABC-type transport system involved in cytochrome bd biosynthesis fused ATPase/permease subunit
MATQRSSGRLLNSMVALLLILAAVALLATIVLIAVGESGYAVAPGIFVVLLLGAAAMDAMVSRRKLETHAGDAKAVESDSEDTTPGLVQAKDEPVGVSSEVHTELDEHDLPLDHPGRPKVEQQRADAEAAGKPRRDEAGMELGG